MTVQVKIQHGNYFFLIHPILHGTLHQIVQGGPSIAIQTQCYHLACLKD